MREVRTKRQVHTEGAHSRASDEWQKMLAAHFQTVPVSERIIERVEIRRSGKLILIEGKEEELLRVSWS